MGVRFKARSGSFFFFFFFSQKSGAAAAVPAAPPPTALCQAWTNGASGPGRMTSAVASYTSVPLMVHNLPSSDVLKDGQPFRNSSIAGESGLCTLFGVGPINPVILSASMSSSTEECKPSNSMVTFSLILRLGAFEQAVCASTEKGRM